MSYNNDLINLKKELLKIWYNRIVSKIPKQGVKKTQNNKIATAFKELIVDEDLERQVRTLIYIPTIVLEEVLDSIDSYINKKEVLALIKKTKAQAYQITGDNFFHTGEFYELQFPKAIQNLENSFSEDELAEYNKTKSLPNTSLEKMLENSYFAKVHNHAHSIAIQEIDKHIPAATEMLITKWLERDMLDSEWCRCPKEEFYKAILRMRELDVSYREFEQPFEIYECKIDYRPYITLKRKGYGNDPFSFLED